MLKQVPKAQPKDDDKLITFSRIQTQQDENQENYDNVNINIENRNFIDTELSLISPFSETKKGIEQTKQTETLSMDLSPTITSSQTNPF